MNKFIICEKIGMTERILEDGKLMPVTVLKIIPSTVIRNKTIAIDGYESCVIGYGTKKARKINKPTSRLFEKHNLPIHSNICEVHFNESEKYKSGDALTLDQFEMNDVVHVRSKTKGRGYTGTIKRWNFRRGPMSHGSKSHRIPGSIGGGTTPGRVIKGKKMAGHYGNEYVTIKNLKVVEVNDDSQTLLLLGSVPGHNRTTVMISS